MLKAKDRGKKVFLVDSYAMNTGDMGILLSLIDELKRSKAHILGIESSHPDELKRINDDSLTRISLYPRIFNIEAFAASQDKGLISKLIPFVLGIIDSLSFLFWSVMHRLGVNGLWIIRPSRRSQAKSIGEADYIWSVGGGFLSTHYMYGFRLYVQLLAYVLNKNMVIFSQSIGPFDSWLSKRLIPWFLKKAYYISAREPWTEDYLRSFGVIPHRTHDIAFNLGSPSVSRDRKVAFCIKSASESYDSAMVSCAEKLIEDGYSVIFISQTPADDEKLNNYSKLIKSSNAEFYKYGLNPRKVKALYGSCEFLISSRMHAIIFASEQGVPFISISYEPKFIGLHEALNYSSELMLDEDGLTSENLAKVVNSLLRDYEKHQRALVEATADIKNINTFNLDQIFNDREI